MIKLMKHKLSYGMSQDIIIQCDQVKNKRLGLQLNQVLQNRSRAMGSLNSRSRGIGYFEESQWEQLERNNHENRQSYGQFVSLQNSSTNEEVDKYELFFESEKQERNYYECALQRMREDYIVNIIHYKNKSVKNLCSNIYRSEIYLEHIPVRLSNITDIPYPENLYILKNSLLGFEQLHSLIGTFQVEEDLFCIDNYGEVKVWMNTDLSKNYPLNEGIDKTYISESEMVTTVIKLVEENTDASTCPQLFSQFLKTKNKNFPSFGQAIGFLDDYISHYKAAVPHYCESVLQIFNYEQQSLQKIDAKEEGDSQIIIGDIVIPKLQIGKSLKKEGNNFESNVEQKEQKQEEIEIQLVHHKFKLDKSHQKQQRSTIKKQKPQSSHYPLNSTDRTKNFKQQFTKMIQDQSLRQNQVNSHRIHQKEHPREEKKSQILKPLINFTYTSRTEENRESKVEKDHEFKYSTGFGDELSDLDPDIAADLTAYYDSFVG